LQLERKKNIILRFLQKYLVIEAIAILLLAGLTSLTIFSFLGSNTKNNQIAKIEKIGIASKPVVLKPKTINNLNIGEKLASRRVRKGDSIGRILGGLRIDDIDIYNISNSLKKIFKLSRLKVGNKIYINYHDINFDGTEKLKKRVIEKFKLKVSDTLSYEVTRLENGKYSALEKKQELLSRLQVKSGIIQNSLYQDAADAGIPSKIILDFIKFYSFDLDFQRDIQKGDKFQIFYETFYNNDGEFVKNGDIIYCKFKVRNRVLSNYKYTTSKGNTYYFNEKGQSVRKSLIRTPVKGARLSSRFGMRRHPILGYNKMHTGVDFAARTGTPIISAGDGKVVRKGWNGGYGKYIKIRHNSRYTTAYAHLSRYAKSLRVGSRVRQGQTIGYVGSTGRSTGPHLHYEVHSYGKYTNPSRVKQQSKIVLRGKEFNRYKIHRNRIDFILNNAFAEAKIN
jgi:murein DD-endopeptidase MepM/ murein hydrolase activator NlpD